MMKKVTFATLGLFGLSACSCDSLSGECNVDEPFGNAPLNAVTTLAGNGHQGIVDGIGGRDGEAEFYGVYDVAIAPDGTIFAIEEVSSSIRMIDPCNVVSTFAGGEDEFTFPQGIAIDDAGNLYVADTGHHRVRKVDTDGNITTLAGSGEPGFANGSGAAAQFNRPSRVAVDAGGNVYVSDTGNDRIRKISPDGNVTTLAGNGNPNFEDGPADQAELTNPEGIAVDAAGVVYVAEPVNSSIRRIEDGNVTTIASNLDSNPATFVDGPDGFNIVRDVAVDADGNVFIADTSNYVIRMLAPDGKLSVVAGTGESDDVDAAAHGAQLSNPTGITLDANANVIIADVDRVKLLRLH
jgi:sugar lactone lactonase YvrE